MKRIHGARFQDPDGWFSPHPGRKGFGKAGPVRPMCGAIPVADKDGPRRTGKVSTGWSWFLIGS